MKLKKAFSSPYVLLPLLLLMWASLAAGSKTALQAIDVHQYMFFTCLIAFVTFVLLVMLNKDARDDIKNIRKSDTLLLIICGILVYLYYFLYNSALSIIDATEASIINYTFPILIVVFDTIINRTRFTALKAVSLIIGLFGTIIIITGGNILAFRLSDPAGALLAFGAACSWALFSVLGRRPKGNLLLRNAIYMAICFVLATLEILTLSQFILPAPSTMLLIFWIGSFVMAISTYIWFKIFNILSVSLVANIAFITPFLTLCLIAIFLDETMTLAHVAGLAFILTAIAVQKIRSPDLKHKK